MEYDDGGLAQLARAPALQAGGHRFEPDILHNMVTVSQLVRELVCGTRGRGFEPHQSPYKTKH